MMLALSKKDKKMIDRAFEISQEATHKFRIGCVIYDKKPLTMAANCGIKTHPNLPGLVDKLHAEMKALKVYNNVNGADIVVVRGSKTNPRLAKPCKYCLERIKNAGIRRVIYSTDNGFEVLRLPK
jgi:tRNA(Arg) A34 adenosine deaminase TadA